VVREPALAKSRFVGDRVFHAGYPLAKGRNLHLQGRFDKEDEKPGARMFYLASRQPDQNINRFESSQVLREAFGIQQELPKGEKEQKEEIENWSNIFRAQKHHATYWLGLSYHEAGNEAGAIEWLAQRTMEAYPPSPWIPGARYNLARCYEDLGQWDAARKWLESDKDSPQRHGNLLRAKWIAQRHPEAAAEPAAAPPAAAEAGEPKANTAEAASGPAK
jgi:hypothetical protein